MNDCLPKIRVGVIGAGYLGQYHAEKYAAMDAVELVDIADIDAGRAVDSACRHNTRALTEFIESHRLSIYTGRSTDVGVVLDLMIHDIDIILNFVGSEVSRIHASGVAVVSDNCDIANARIEFASGCVANITASRISTEKQRKIRLFQKNGYIAVDFAKCEITHIEQTRGSKAAIIPGTEIHRFSFLEGDALEEELRSFVGAVGAGREPVVTGHMGYQALSVALGVMDRIDETARRFGEL